MGTEPTQLAFVGSAVCGRCHADPYTAWQTSHHAKAIQSTSTPENVLAPFSGHLGNTAFRMHAGQPYVALEETAGKTTEFPVPYTFGITPLQQYLVDVGQGKLQTLRETWDARTAAEGGQRWYQQYPDEHIPPGDVLHWTSMAFNWNSACADCHSTYVQKNYAPETDSYNTTFAELTVGCEACHGMGSAHSADPAQALPGNSTLGNAHRQTTLVQAQTGQPGNGQAEVCAQCHARRQQIAEGFTPGNALYDHYRPVLLNPPLYHADGQILDEVYVYGSFASSKMAARGVNCTDCHAPHSGTLRLPGNQVCQQCHSPAGNPRFPTLTKRVYDTTAHHMHTPGTPGASCTDCHMPTRTYMGVDVRHDHSLRIPRPDHTARHGEAAAPNPCSRCHTERSAETLAQQIAAHTGHAPAASPADILADQHPRTQPALIELAQDTSLSAIVRATALSRLVSDTSAGAARAHFQAARSPAPLLRLGALEGLHLIEPSRAIQVLARLLDDPLRAVRIAAASTALRLFEPATRAQLGSQLTIALEEYRASLELHAERAEAQVNLAQLELALAQPVAAEQNLLRALAIAPGYVPALLNLADLLRATGRDALAASYLQEAISVSAPQPEALHAYALWLVRNGEREASLAYFARAYRSAPEDAGALYYYAVALNSLDQPEQARSLLEQARNSRAYSDQVAQLHQSLLGDAERINQAP